MESVATAKQVGAFFDMDKTLLSISSTMLWTRYMRKRGELPFRDFARILGALVRYKLGQLDMVETTRAFVRDLAGQPEDLHEAKTRRWVAEQLVHYVADEGRAWLESHRRLGHRVALITASPRYTADPLAETLGLAPEDVLATRFEVRNGRFTGQLLEPMLYGAGKLAAAGSYARRHGLKLESSFFYTDSISDLPLLENVGHPVAVNPDRPLRRMAEARGWSIVRFY